MGYLKEADILWDDNPIDITEEANFIWSIANKLRGSYMPDKYGDVIIPMTIIRRFECALEKTKTAVLKKIEQNPTYPEKAMYRISGYQFFNTSGFTLAELCNDPDNIAANFKSYISGFSANVQDILKELQMNTHINKMDNDGCLFSVVKAFSELDLSVEKVDSVEMGYIFENLIGRFFQNVEAGQFYTGRDIIKLCVSLLISEGCEDIFDDGKIITVCDQACGTGGMLSTAYSYLKHFNPSADVRLFGQEFMGVSYAVGLAEMLIKGQDSENFVHLDTFKEDRFADKKMRFVIENPPFGTPWGGKDAKTGQEKAVRDEYAKGKSSRWPAGLPSTSDSQLIFVQSAIDKLDQKCGRAAIIENGSPLFFGDTASGESQIRRWLLENDLIEAIIQLPTDLFYNTAITTYIWIISNNKRLERKGKIQLINASEIYHKLRKPIGEKKNEFTPDDRCRITNIYSKFENNEISKIFNNTEFIFREYTIMQPLQRSYMITNERIENLCQSNALNCLYDEAKVGELEEKGTQIEAKEQKKLEYFYQNKSLYDSIISTLCAHISNEKWISLSDFMPYLSSVLSAVTTDKKLLEKIAYGLSVMDKSAVIQKDKKGEIIYDKASRNTEIVKWDEDIQSYMKREVLPHVPDAEAFFEENLEKKIPIIKTGAEIPFTRYFYSYQPEATSDELAEKFKMLNEKVDGRIKRLFG